VELLPDVTSDEDVAAESVILSEIEAELLSVVISVEDEDTVDVTLVVTLVVTAGFWLQETRSQASATTILKNVYFFI
jgi:hypothetical protein